MSSKQMMSELLRVSREFGAHKRAGRSLYYSRISSVHAVQYQGCPTNVALSLSSEIAI